MKGWRNDECKTKNKNMYTQRKNGGGMRRMV